MVPSGPRKKAMKRLLLTLVKHSRYKIKFEAACWCTLKVLRALKWVVEFGMSRSWLG